MLQVEIRIKGQIAEHWSAWFEGLTLVHTAENETALIGDVIDQAALYGLLAKLRDLGLSLQSVSSVQKEPQGEKRHLSASPDHLSPPPRPEKP